MERGGDEGDESAAVFEDGVWDHGLRGDVNLVDHECKQAGGAEGQGYEGSPGGPWIHDAAPGERDEEGGDAADEEDGAEVVDAQEFLVKGAGRFREAEKEYYEDGCDADKGEVDVEDPSLLALALDMRNFKVGVEDIPR